MQAHRLDCVFSDVLVKDGVSDRMKDSYQELLIRWISALPRPVKKLRLFFTTENSSSM